MLTIKTLATTITLFMLTSCGTVELAAPPEDEKKAKDQDESSEDDDSELKDDEATEVTVETTTKVTVGGKSRESNGLPREVRRFELRNDFAPNKEFVSSNFCSGSNLRDCWIRSGYLIELSDGSYKASLEIWDTSNPTPFTVEEVDIEAGEERAALLTDKGKLPEDTGVGYKMVWGVIVPEIPAIGIVYDWNSDGPGVQGDTILDTLEFFEIESED